MEDPTAVAAAAHMAVAAVDNDRSARAQAAQIRRLVSPPLATSKPPVPVAIPLAADLVQPQPVAIPAPAPPPPTIDDALLANEAYKAAFQRELAAADTPALPLPPPLPTPPPGPSLDAIVAPGPELPQRSPSGSAALRAAALADAAALFAGEASPVLPASAPLASHVDINAAVAVSALLQPAPLPLPLRGSDAAAATAAASAAVEAAARAVSKVSPAALGTDGAASALAATVPMGDDETQRELPRTIAGRALYKMAGVAPPPPPPAVDAHVADAATAAAAADAAARGFIRGLPSPPAPPPPAPDAVWECAIGDAVVAATAPMIPVIQPTPVAVPTAPVVDAVPLHVVVPPATLVVPSYDAAGTLAAAVPLPPPSEVRLEPPPPLEATVHLSPPGLTAAPTTDAVLPLPLPAPLAPAHAAAAAQLAADAAVAVPAVPAAPVALDVRAPQVDAVPAAAPVVPPALLHYTADPLPIPTAPVSVPALHGYDPTRVLLAAPLTPGRRTLPAVPQTYAAASAVPAAPAAPSVPVAVVAPAPAPTPPVAPVAAPALLHGGSGDGAPQWQPTPSAAVAAAAVRDAERHAELLRTAVVSYPPATAAGVPAGTRSDALAAALAVVGDRRWERHAVPLPPPARTDAAAAYASPGAVWDVPGVAGTVPAQHPAAPYLNQRSTVLGGGVDDFSQWYSQHVARSSGERGQVWAAGNGTQQTSSKLPQHAAVDGGKPSAAEAAKAKSPAESTAAATPSTPKRAGGGSRSAAQKNSETVAAAAGAKQCTVALRALRSMSDAEWGRFTAFTHPPKATLPFLKPLLLLLGIVQAPSDAAEVYKAGCPLWKAGWRQFRKTPRAAIETALPTLAPSLLADYPVVRTLLKQMECDKAELQRLTPAATQLHSWCEGFLAAFAPQPHGLSALSADEKAAILISRERVPLSPKA